MPRCKTTWLLLPALWSIILSSSVQAQDWPGWRGPTGMGQSPAKGLPVNWGGKSQENVLWKKPLFDDFDKIRRDQNQSSPIVSKGRVFVTVSYWPAGVSDKEYPEHHVLCFDAENGAKLWDKMVAPGPWLLTDLRGGYTAPTPAADGERVYVVFGSSVIAALDYDGKIVWRKEITPFNFDVAIGASPVVYKDTVLMLCDLIKGKSGSFLIAYDAKTGDVRWKQDRPVDWAHCTPALATINGKTQLLAATANGPQGLDPDTGATLWSYTTSDRVGDTVTPVFGGGVVYCDSGRGGPGVAVDPTGSGDVTKTHFKWKIATIPEGFSSPVIVGNLLFRSHSPGVVTCRKLSDGTEVDKEKKKRFEGLDPALSPIATADGRLYFAGAGKSFVLQAGPELKLLGTGDLGDSSRASPAIAGNRIFLKGTRYLFCIGEAKPASAQAAQPAAPDWQPLTTELILKEKPGYGTLSGVTVDPKTGDLYIHLSDKGIYRSTDQGKSWHKRGPAIKGRTETPGCLLLDPAGKSKKFLLPLVYGAPVGVSPDLGETWKFLSPKSEHIDWCAVDWSDPEMKFMLALRHESGDALIVSRDGGKTFENVGKGYGPAWVFDNQTAVVADAKSKAKPGLLRTTDGGKSFEKCGDFTIGPRNLPVWYDGKLYWLAEGAIITTSDKGQSWQKFCEVKDGRFGPVFDKNGQHLFVLTGKGILESTDAGSTWAKAIPLPKDVNGPLVWLAYDSIHGSLYAMKMGSDLYRLTK